MVFLLSCLAGIFLSFLLLFLSSSPRKTKKNVFSFLAKHISGKDFGSTLTHGKIPHLELLSFLYSYSHKLSLIPFPHPCASAPSILCCQTGCAPKHLPTSSSHSLSALPTLSYHSSSYLELCSHTSMEVHLSHFLITYSVRMVRFSAADFYHLKNFSNKS